MGATSTKDRAGAEQDHSDYGSILPAGSRSKELEKKSE